MPEAVCGRKLTTLHLYSDDKNFKHTLFCLFIFLLVIVSIILEDSYLLFFFETGNVFMTKFHLIH